MARIFVVEDDASLREELMRLLELQGHTALTGTAFDRIVDDVLAAAPDCVILDLKLPGPGGHTAVSYTHLDVYKRQLVGALVGVMAALLFTWAKERG